MDYQAVDNAYSGQNDAPLFRANTLNRYIFLARVRSADRSHYEPTPACAFIASCIRFCVGASVVRPATIISVIQPTSSVV